MYRHSNVCVRVTDLFRVSKHCDCQGRMSGVVEVGIHVLNIGLAIKHGRAQLRSPVSTRAITNIILS